MTSATFLPAVGGDNSTVSDDSNPLTGLANGGHTTRFVPALAQIVAIAVNVLANATAALAAAQSAINAPGTSATCPTSLAISIANKSFALAQTGKLFGVGQRLTFASAANPLNQMSGVLTAFVSGTGVGTLAADTISGTGTFGDWVVTLAASPGSVATTRQVLAGGIATGGGALSADRTITVPEATVAEIRNGTADKAIAPDTLIASADYQTLTYGASIPWDCAAGYNAKVTLAGNGAFAAPTNIKPGLGYVLAPKQDATGSRVPSYAAAFNWGNGSPPVLSTGANKEDYLFFIGSVDGTKLIYTGFSKSA